MTVEGLGDVQLHLVDSVEKAGEFLTWLGERRPHDAIAIDTETGEYPGRDRKDALSPWHGRLRLVQVGEVNRHGQCHGTSGQVRSIKLWISLMGKLFVIT